VLVDGKPTGLAQCNHDLVHRAKKLACEPLAPRPQTCGAQTSMDGGTSADGGTSTGDGTPTCTSDADCTERPGGRCDKDYDVCQCNYGCLSDEDCDDRELCLCTETGGQCIAAACTSDADCAGSFCTVLTHYVLDDGTIEAEAACASTANECETDSDCASELNLCSVDVYSGDTARTCATSSTGCSAFGSGRPFLVEGAARQAEVVA
jgi:hypothetical protein